MSILACTIFLACLLACHCAIDLNNSIQLNWESYSLEVKLPTSREKTFNNAGDQCSDHVSIIPFCKHSDYAMSITVDCSALVNDLGSQLPDNPVLYIGKDRNTSFHQMNVTVPTTTPSSAVTAEPEDPDYDDYMTRFRARTQHRASIRLEYDNTKQSCYYCWIQTPGGLKSSPAFSARVIDNCEVQKHSGPTKTVQLRAGADTTFTCWNKTINESVSISWYKKLRSSNNYAVISTQRELAKESFTVAGATLDDAGSYRCILWFNEYHTSYQQDFELRLVSKPPPISVLHIMHVSDTEVRISWDAGYLDYLSGGEVRQFKIKYYPFGSRPGGEGVSSVIGSDQVDPSQVIEKTVQISRITLENLRPSTMYVIELIQSNAAGDSPMVRHIFLTKNTNVIGDYDMEVNATFGDQITLKCYTYTDGQGITWMHHGSIVANNTAKYLIQNVSRDNAGPYSCHKQYAQVEGGHHFRIRVKVFAPPPTPRWIKCRVEDDLIRILWFQDDGESGSVSNEPDGHKATYRKIDSDDPWRVDIFEHDPRIKRRVLSIHPESGSVYFIRLVATGGGLESGERTCLLAVD